MKAIKFLLLVLAYASSLSAFTLTVTAVQLSTSDAGNFVKMRECVKEAKKNGANLVIFPEESVFGWLNPQAFLDAAPIPGQYSDAFAEIAREEGIWLATGLAEQGPEAGAGSQQGAHQVYNSGILINPKGDIVLHHRQINVIKNAFTHCACRSILNQSECSYLPGDLSTMTIAKTPFGSTALLVCADAFSFPSTQVLDRLKQLQPNFVIVFWGITAATYCECGTHGFNATEYTQNLAIYLESAVVVGANATGIRYHGRYLPSVYCGTSGASTSSGDEIKPKQDSGELLYFDVELPNIDEECAA